jgi:antitoxin (DNA-binding transcriptional repressor) of toxin-antitoxin stability system
MGPSWSYYLTMKAINVTELKAHLSRYLRLASRGARIVVKDRDEPIAQLGPPQTEALSWRDRLAREGRLRVGTQDWERLSISPLDRRVDIQASLQAVREDASEVRRR